MDKHFDVVVVGAGPAGAATARRLASQGCRVALLERTALDNSRVGESLAPSVQPLLKELDVWATFQSLPPLPSYGTRSVWGSDQAEQQAHLMTPYLQGWHVDRLAFDRMLANSAVEAGAQLSAGVRIKITEVRQHGFILECAHSNVTRQIETSLLIDATGRSASVARKLGARQIVFDKLVGLAAQFDDPSAAEHCYTLVETTADGWWYSSPVASRRSVAILMTDSDLVREQTTGNPIGWQRALQVTCVTAARFAGCPLVAPPRVHSAISQRTLRAPNDRLPWLAVGDAALAVDPISGSGVVRALRTARDAADAALAVLSKDRDAIDRYEENRNAECTTYLEERADYYAIERRWAGAPFWARRALMDRAFGT